MNLGKIAKKFVLLSLVAGMMIVGFSCSKNNEADSVKYKKNLPNIGDKEPMPGYSYFCGSFENPGSETVSSMENPVAILIDVAENCFLSTVSCVVNYNGVGTAHLDFEIYSFSENYGKTVKKKPVYTSDVEVEPAGGRITANVALGAVSNGKFLCVFKNAGQTDIEFQLKPCGEQTEKVSATVSYSGSKEIDSMFRSFATYYDYGETVSATQTNKTKVSKEKAHVILILGQSNATGQALVSYLKQTATEEDFARYEKGYDSVQIFFNVDGGSNTSKNKFVPVTLGQGNSTEKFGPEIGMAEVLSEKYPDETFYIIKASVSGAGLSKHFQNNNGEYANTMAAVTKGLNVLKEEGLDPEIFAVVWMQGETDAMYYDDSITYAEKQNDYINRITNKFEKYVAENGFTFIDAQISDANFWTSREVVNVSKEICDIYDVNRVYLKTEGLRTYKENNDAAHYDSQDNIALGKLFGEAVANVYNFEQ